MIFTKMQVVDCRQYLSKIREKYLKSYLSWLIALSLRLSQKSTKTNPVAAREAS